MANILPIDKRRPEPLHVCSDACGIVAWDPMCPLYTDRPSQALSPDTVAQLLNTLRSPAYRAMFREVLLDLLADDIGDIAQAVAEEVA